MSIIEIKKTLVIILLFSLITSCYSLREQYEKGIVSTWVAFPAKEIKQYCIAVLRDAGFRENNKHAMARCIQSKEQSERELRKREFIIL